MPPLDLSSSSSSSSTASSGRTASSKSSKGSISPSVTHTAVETQTDTGQPGAAPTAACETPQQLLAAGGSSASSMTVINVVANAAHGHDAQQQLRGAEAEVATASPPGDQSEEQAVGLQKRKKCQTKSTSPARWAKARTESSQAVVEATLHELNRLGEVLECPETVVSVAEGGMQCNTDRL
mmetsp:Transcript_2155/g.3939  ORF Transcript_2155/g.3939 Transcript_2155/m.3939 type:complete len:181 (+) Transcript_2155:2884-3426(+)